MRIGIDLTLTRPMGGPPAFTPADLSPVAWYDPSDLSSMWKDTAGTQAVTADGDAVARINDKSGNALHLLQATAANRPLYKTAGGLHWLQFDGTNDFLTINNAALRLLGDLTLCAGAYKDVGGTFGEIMVCRTNAATINPYEWRFNNTAGFARAEFLAANGTTLESDVSTVDGALATAIVVSLRRLAATNVEFSVNGSRATLTHTMVPTSDASSAFGLGATATAGAPLAGRIYGAAVYGSRLSDANLALVEAYMTDKIS